MADDGGPGAKFQRMIEKLQKTGGYRSAIWFALFLYFNLLVNELNQLPPNQRRVPALLDIFGLGQTVECLSMEAIDSFSLQTQAGLEPRTWHAPCSSRHVGPSFLYANDIPKPGQ
ncbi:hypothetical protein R3P38DRAFT_2799372 [Favolaschia claudopus]|uniref:Uncharacterized protein n=1 Tax=Favolaschia claudopus TaxID=2862362 RepID=A0AAW0A0L6_9AGAR